MIVCTWLVAAAANAAEDDRISALRQAVRANPSSAESRAELGRELLRTGDFNGAIRESEVAVNLQPASAEYRFLLGTCYVRRAKSKKVDAGYFADLDRAATALQSAALMKPGLPNLHNLLGWLRQEVGDFPAAVEEFRLATRLEPGSASAFHNLGSALVLDQQPAEAIAAYQKAIDLDADFVSAHLNLDSALQQRGGREAILREQSAAVRKAPGSAVARARLGQAYWMNDRFRESAVELRRAIAIAPQFAIAHFYLGRALRQLGDNEGALRAFETARQIKPGAAEFQAQLGGLQLSQGKVEAAVATLRRAVQLDPQLDQAHYQLGLALRRAGQTEEAAKHLELAAEAKRAKLSFSQAGLGVVQGIARLREGKPAEAVAELQKAVREKPDYGIAHYHLGIALAQTRAFREAVTEFEAALRLRPQSAEIHYNFGIALWQMGDSDRATAEFRRTIELDAGHGLAHCALGKAMVRAGDAANGEAAQRRARELTSCP